MGERPSNFRIYSLVSLMTTMWSLNYIVVKCALREFPPLFATAIRMTLAGFIMLGVYAWHLLERKDPGVERVRDIWLLGFSASWELG